MDAETVSYKAKSFEPRNLAFFFLIVVGLQAIADGLLIAGVLKMPSIDGPAALLDDPRLIILTLAAWGPIIAAFLVTALTEGKSGVRALWSRFWNRNLSIKWLLVTLLILPALALVANIVTRVLDGQEYPLFFLYNPPWSIIPMFIMAFIFNGVFEEFGWRGYVLPRFQVKWNALASGLILGVIWAAWHAGQWSTPGSHLYNRNFWLWALGTILLSILMTWIFNNTKGSVLAASLLHGMANTGIFWFQLEWRYYVIELIAVILIVIIFGAKNLVREKPEPVGTLATAKVT